eukprot:COSAG04_NODE_3350_length_2903_cov_1.512482_3_plen_113_part_00
MGCHTARYAHTIAMFNEVTHTTPDSSGACERMLSSSVVVVVVVITRPRCGQAVYDGTNATLTDIAFRCYNWASYMVLSSGLVVVGPAASNNLWFRIQCALPTHLTTFGVQSL